jgi:phenylalanyl-tRNA synthetase alpha subunit
LDNIEISLQNYYSFLADQIKLKNVDPKLEIQQAFETIQAKVIDPVQYAQAVRKIACVLNAKRDDRELTESDIISSLNTSNELTRKKLEANIESVNKLLEKCQQELNGHINDANLWKQAVSYKFSPTLKHADIKIISDHVVKSANNSGYKFIIMEPHLETGTSIKKFAFKIK